jgi:hypothetical protein
MGAESRFRNISVLLFYNFDYTQSPKNSFTYYNASLPETSDFSQIVPSTGSFPNRLIIGLCVCPFPRLRNFFLTAEKRAAIVKTARRTEQRQPCGIAKISWRPQLIKLFYTSESPPRTSVRNEARGSLTQIVVIQCLRQRCSFWKRNLLDERTS